MVLADRIRRTRAQLGYTQAQFGALCGLPGERVGCLERAAWPFTLPRLVQERLAAVLGCSVAALGVGMPGRRPHRLAHVLHPAAVTQGVLLARRRLRLGLTQEALSDRLQVHRTVISRWEHGRIRPSKAMRMRLATALACSLDDLAVAD